MRTIVIRWTARAATVGAMLVGVGTGWAQASMGGPGCCCVAKGTSYTCSDKNQADCLALQPAAPTFPKHADWRKAWSEYVAASEAAEAKPLRGGWIAEPCEK